MKLLVFGCELTLPEGYIISSTGAGLIRGQFVGSNMEASQFFEYFPVNSWEEVASKIGGEIPVLLSERIGPLTHLVVEYRSPMNGSYVMWKYNVFSSESEYFGFPARANDSFESQFRSCAEA